MYNMCKGAGTTGPSTAGAVTDPEPSGEKEAVTRTLSWYRPLMGSEAFSRGTQTSHGDTWETHGDMAGRLPPQSGYLHPPVCW